MEMKKSSLVSFTTSSYSSSSSSFAYSDSEARNSADKLTELLTAFPTENGVFSLHIFTADEEASFKAKLEKIVRQVSLLQAPRTEVFNLSFEIWKCLGLNRFKDLSGDDFSHSSGLNPYHIYLHSLLQRVGAFVLEGWASSTVQIKFTKQVQGKRKKLKETWDV